MGSEAQTATEVSSVTFENKKTTYFIWLGLHLRQALKMHRESGLWERDAFGVRLWGNVTEHCLVEAARAIEFCDILGFSKDLTHDLVTAAALHDHFKRRETRIVTDHRLSWDSFATATSASEAWLRKYNWSEPIIELASAVGHRSLPRLGGILIKKQWQPHELAYVIMHYIDDYTIDADWVVPAQNTAGGRVNDLDHRIDKREANPRYLLLNEAGRRHFSGFKTFEMQRLLDHKLESALADQVAGRTKTKIDPKDLPYFIDRKIRARIAAL